MSVKRCDLRNIGSLQMFYDQIATQLAFPEHFGANLDALWDMLSPDITGPVEIVWHNCTWSALEIGDDYITLKALLEDLAVERKDIKVLFR